MYLGLFTRSSASLGFVLAALALAPAGAAAASATPAGCTVLPVSQPFLSWNDTNWYSLVPGQTATAFVGTGWSLSGGASVVTTTRADGRTGTVLNLPAGSSATSAPICVASDYPTARMMVRNVTGYIGTFMSVSYDGAAFQSAGNLGSQASGWTLSRAANTMSAPISGWHLLRFRFDSAGSGSQIYNLWVDPRMCR